MTRRRWLIAGIAVGVVSLLIRLWLFQQPINSDDTQYFSQASQATDLRSLGDPSQANGLRYPVVVIPAFYSQVFDSGFTAFYATIYTFAILAFAAVFVFAWVLSGPRAAVIAAGIWATSYVAIAIDTRLTPDNLGTAFALFGLALVGWVALPPPDGAKPPPERPRTVAALVVAGGFLLWLGFFCRESFFVFGGVAVGFGVLSKRRLLILASLGVGLFAGFLFEAQVMSSAFGDALLRFRQAASYGQNVASSGAVEGTAYSGYHFADLFTRYPRLVLEASPMEAMLHFGGLIGFVVWGVRGRDRRNLAKLGCGLGAYGFLAFGIVSVDPVIPVMREKLRYYVTAAPLFYLAVAELIELGMVARLGGRFARWVDHRARMISVTAIGGVLVIANLWIASGSAEFARNGNDVHWTAAARLRADASLRDRPRVVATDGRTARVTSILLARDGGWDHVDLGAAVANPSDTYALLDWKRLNANVKSQFVAAPLTHEAYGLIEDHYLVGRSVRGNNIVDTFFLGAAPPRSVERAEDAFPSAWSVMCVAAKTYAQATVGAQDCAADAEILLYQGGGPPWRSRGTRLAGDRFVQAVVQADTTSVRTMRAYLYWWAPHDTTIQRQSMGSVEVAPGARAYRLWTYLPQSAEGYRVVLRTRSDVEVSSVDVRFLGRHPDDDVRPLGTAWRATPIRDRRLDLVASAIRTAAGERDVVVTTDALTADSGRTQLPDWRWEVDAASASGGFLIVDPARAPVTASVLDRGAVLARSLDGDSVVDVVALDPTLARDRVELAVDFPAGWTRILAATKELSPIGASAAFTNADANAEYIYSGAEAPWRAPPAQPIDADRFVEVTGVVSDTGGGGPLRVYLYWWPPGAKARITQLLGTVAATADPSPFSVWTYLPKEAGAFRIGFRAGAGVTVTDVRAFSLGRVDGDRLTVFGAPW